jgi:hypothetical protein
MSSGSACTPSSEVGNSPDLAYSSISRLPGTNPCWISILVPLGKIEVGMHADEVTESV